MLGTNTLRPFRLVPSSECDLDICRSDPRIAGKLGEPEIHPIISHSGSSDHNTCRSLEKIGLLLIALNEASL